MPETYIVADHFRDKEPVVSEIYARLLHELRQFGEVTESAKKTSIHLDNQNGFAGVYTLKSAINLHFRSDAKIDSPRIIRIEQLSARRFMHPIKLQNVVEIDAELLGWLKSAYELAGDPALDGLQRSGFGE
jgi:hypothetical protein